MADATQTVESPQAGSQAFTSFKDQPQQASQAASGSQAFTSFKDQPAPAKPAQSGQELFQSFSPQGAGTGDGYFQSFQTSGAKRLPQAEQQVEHNQLVQSWADQYKTPGAALEAIRGNQMTPEAGTEVIKLLQDQYNRAAPDTKIVLDQAEKDYQAKNAAAQADAQANAKNQKQPSQQPEDLLQRIAGVFLPGPEHGAPSGVQLGAATVQGLTGITAAPSADPVSAANIDFYRGHLQQLLDNGTLTQDQVNQKNDELTKLQTDMLTANQQAGELKPLGLTPELERARLAKVQQGLADRLKAIIPDYPQVVQQIATSREAAAEAAKIQTGAPIPTAQRATDYSKPRIPFSDEPSASTSLLQQDPETTKYTIGLAAKDAQMAQLQQGQGLTADAQARIKQQTEKAGGTYQSPEQMTKAGWQVSPNAAGSVQNTLAKAEELAGQMIVQAPLDRYVMMGLGKLAYPGKYVADRSLNVGRFLNETLPKTWYGRTMRQAIGIGTGIELYRTGQSAWDVLTDATNEDKWNRFVGDLALDVGIPLLLRAPGWGFKLAGYYGRGAANLMRMAAEEPPLPELNWAMQRKGPPMNMWQRRAISEAMPAGTGLPLSPLPQMAGKAGVGYLTGAAIGAPFARKDNVNDFLQDVNQNGLFGALYGLWPHGAPDWYRGGPADFGFRYVGPDVKLSPEKRLPLLQAGDPTNPGQLHPLMPAMQEATSTMDASRAQTAIFNQHMARKLGMDYFVVPDRVYGEIQAARGTGGTQGEFNPTGVKDAYNPGGRTQIIVPQSRFDFSNFHEAVGHPAWHLLSPEDQHTVRTFLAQDPNFDKDAFAQRYAREYTGGRGVQPTGFDDLPKQADVDAGDPDAVAKFRQWGNLSQESLLGEAAVEHFGSVFSGDTPENWLRAEPTWRRKLAQTIVNAAHAIGLPRVSADVDGPLGVNKNYTLAMASAPYLRRLARGELTPQIRREGHAPAGQIQIPGYTPPRFEGEPPEAPTPPTPPTREAVEKLAYQLSERPDAGTPEENWVRAERILSGEEPPPGAPVRERPGVEPVPAGEEQPGLQHGTEDYYNRVIQLIEEGYNPGQAHNIAIGKMRPTGKMEPVTEAPEAKATPVPRTPELRANAIEALRTMGLKKKEAAEHVDAVPGATESEIVANAFKRRQAIKEGKTPPSSYMPFGGGRELPEPPGEPATHDEVVDSFHRALDEYRPYFDALGVDIQEHPVFPAGITTETDGGITFNHNARAFAEGVAEARKSRDLSYYTKENLDTKMRSIMDEELIHSAEQVGLRKKWDAMPRDKFGQHKIPFNHYSTMDSTLLWDGLDGTIQYARERGDTAVADALEKARDTSWQLYKGDPAREAPNDETQKFQATSELVRQLVQVRREFGAASEQHYGGVWDKVRGWISNVITGLKELASRLTSPHLDRINERVQGAEEALKSIAYEPSKELYLKRQYMPGGEGITTPEKAFPGYAGFKTPSFPGMQQQEGEEKKEEAPAAPTEPTKGGKVVGVTGSEFGEVDNPERGGYTEPGWNRGAWNANLAGEDNVGFALPPSILQHVGYKGPDANYGNYFNSHYLIRAHNPVTGKTVEGPLKDLGPGRSTGALIDMLWGARKALGFDTNFKGAVNFEIVDKKTGKVVYAPTGHEMEQGGGSGIAKRVPNVGGFPSGGFGYGGKNVPPGMTEAPGAPAGQQAAAQQQPQRTAEAPEAPAGRSYAGTTAGGPVTLENTEVPAYLMAQSYNVPMASGYASYMAGGRRRPAAPEEEPFSLQEALDNIGTATSDKVKRVKVNQAMKLHVDSLDDEDERVQKDPITGLFKGKYFVPGDLMHEHARKDTPELHRQYMDRAQNAMQNGKLLNLSYVSAPAKPGETPTRESRTAAYDLSPAQARAVGSARGIVGGHTIIPTAIGISYGGKGKTNTGYIQGISTSVAAHNAERINNKLGAQSPYPNTSSRKFQADLHGYIHNINNGWEGDGSKPVKPTPGVSVKVNPNHIPYPMQRREADFMNAILQNTAAQEKGPNAQRMKEFAKAGGRLLNEAGEVNKIRHQIDATDPGWSERTLDPAIKHFRGDLIYGMYNQPHEMDQPIRPAPGTEQVTHAMHYQGLPHKEMVAAGYMPFAGPKAKGFKQAQAEGRVFETPVTGVGGRQRFEISDRDMEFHPAYKPTTPGGTTLRNHLEEAYHADPRGRGEIRLDEAIDHPELFRNYPFLRGTKISMDPTIWENGHYEYPWHDKDTGHSGGDRIVLKRPDNRETLAHEIQHAVQHIEGFPPGTNPEAAYRQLSNNLPVQEELMKQYENDHPERRTMSMTDFDKSEKDRRAWKEKRLRDMAEAIYYRSPGEVEARVAGERARGAADEPPEQHLEFARDYAAARSRQGGLSSSIQDNPRLREELERESQKNPPGWRNVSASEAPSYRSFMAGAAKLKGVRKLDRALSPEVEARLGPRPDAEKDKAQERMYQKTGERLDSQVKDPAAIPLEPDLTDEGKFKKDSKGGPSYKKVNYDIANSPLLREKGQDLGYALNTRTGQMTSMAKAPAGTVNRITKEGLDPQNRLAPFLTPTDQLRVSHLEQNGAADTYADELVKYYRSIEHLPEVMAGKEWYDEAEQYLDKNFGKHKNLMANLLAATSAGNKVKINYNMAIKAYHQFMLGKYDKAIELYKQAHEIRQTGKGALMEHIIKNGIHTLLKEDAPKTDEAAMEQWIEHHKITPKSAEGKLFGHNSIAVLKVLAHTWEEEAGGPKTPNFAANMNGRSLQATIDMWAARTMRRLGYEGRTGGQPWLIQPSAETGVNDVDFGLSQIAFRKAAERLGLKPSSLQAILWFAEQKHWQGRGWERAQDAEDRDYRPMLKKYERPKGVGAPETKYHPSQDYAPAAPG